jgi:hypothetical protein
VVTVAVADMAVAVATGVVVAAAADAIEPNFILKSKGRGAYSPAFCILRRKRKSGKVLKREWGRIRIRQQG